MPQPDPQRLVQILNGTRGELLDELAKNLMALNYLLEETDGKPRIVRMLETEATHVEQEL